MRSKLRVSIVVPAYNAGPWIQTTLKAALAQTYPPDEIVVVNDASSDDTHARCRQLIRRRTRVPIVYHEHGVRRGGGATRNTGVEIASGDWIFNLDADDIIPSSLLESFIATASVVGTEAVVHTEFAQFFQDERSTRLRVPVAKRRLLHRWRFESANRKTFLTSPQSPASAGNRLFSRSLYNAVGGYFVDTGPYDAWTFGLSCYAIGCRFVPVPGSEYLHRLHENSYWTRAEREGNNRRYLYDAISHFPSLYSEYQRHLLRPDNPDYPRDPLSALEHAWPTDSDDAT